MVANAWKLGYDSWHFFQTISQDCHIHQVITTDLDLPAVQLSASQHVHTLLGRVCGLEVEKAEAPPSVPHQPHGVHVVTAELTLQLAHSQAAGQGAHKHHGVGVGAEPLPLWAATG